MKKKIILILCVVCVVALAAFFALRGGHDHVYDQEVESEAYRVSGTACEVSYYKSCACGEKGTDTFLASVIHTYPAASDSENVVWDWQIKTDGGYDVVLTLSCVNTACTHTETVQIEDVKAEKVDATQDKDGSITYTAKHTFEGITYISTKADVLCMADTLVEAIEKILFEELSIPSVQEEVLVLYNAYLNLSSDQQALVTNADKLESSVEAIKAIRDIRNRKFAFTSAATVKLGRTLKLFTNAVPYKGIAPSITYTVVSGDATIKSNVLTPTDAGTVVVRAVIRYGDYPVSIVVEKEIEVSPCDVLIEVSLPADLQYLMDKVVVKIGDQRAGYDSTYGIFVGKALPGVTKVTATLAGYESAEKTYNVQLRSYNAVKLEIKDVAYGPAVNIVGGVERWSENGGVITSVVANGKNAQSYYKVANGLTGTNALISATINMKDTTEKDNNRGAGLVFASTKKAVYGIILKPGQGTIALVKGAEQDMNKNGLNSDLKNVTVYNDSKAVTSNGRVEIVALKVFKGDKTYDYTAKLTVVRLNTMVYVLIDDVVCASFRVAELDGVAGGFGVTNFGHDNVTFRNISFSTDKQAAINAATVSVEMGDLQGASVSVAGDKLSDRYLKGTPIRATFKPATDKDYLYYANGEVLSGGSINADGTVTYQITSTENIVLTAKQVQKHLVEMAVQLPANLANLMDQVTVTSSEGNFKYNQTTGKFEGKLLAGDHTITATLPGFAPKSVVCTVGNDADNTAQITIAAADVVVNNPDSTKNWVYDRTTGIVTVNTNGNSRYAFAADLPTTQAVISADITFTSSSAASRGAGVYFAWGDTKYGIALKPGQTGLAYIKNYGQAAVDAITGKVMYNGAEKEADNRIQMPAFEPALTHGQKNYVANAKLTVVRQNTVIRVFVNDKLYLEFTENALKDKEAGFGFFNTGHEAVKFENITYATTDAAIQAVYDAATVTVENGELNGATVTVTGEKWNEEYLLGSELTVTFTPAADTAYIYKANGEALSGGTAGEDGSVTYTMLAEQDIVLSADVVEKCAVTVNVTIPGQVSNLLSKVQVTAEGGTFVYNAAYGRFDGELLPGNHTITATLPGFAPKSVDCAVVSDAENTALITIAPADVVAYNPNAAAGTWTYDPDTSSLTLTKKYQASRFEFAAALPTTQAVISADITFTSTAAASSGGGIYFACTGTNYGIVLKPGQTGVAYVQGTTQQKINSIEKVSLYNGAGEETDGSTNRYHMPGLDPQWEGQKSYTTTAKLTIVRENTVIRVFVNDKLYLEFTERALDGMEGGFGFVNTNHKNLTFNNITYATTDAAIQAVYDAATVTVENGELNGATTSVSGDMLSGRYITGTDVTVTFTPAEGKEYIYKANGETLSGGTDGENGSVTFVIPANQNIVLSAEDVTMYDVNVTVAIPNQDSSLLSKVQVTAEGGTFTYNDESGKFEGKLIRGDHAITATLTGFTPVTGYLTVGEAEGNALTLSISQMKFGPSTKIGGYEPTWEVNGNTIACTRPNNTSTFWYGIANGLTTQNALISANVTYHVGTQHTAQGEGGGFVIAKTTDAVYSIILKPGQGTIALTKGSTQDGVQTNTFYYNEAKANASKPTRVDCPRVAEVRSADSNNKTNNYTVSYKLTVVRQNADIYVFVDNVCYVKFTVNALANAEGGLGVVNFNHDSVTYADITVVTDQSEIGKLVTLP